MLCRLNREVFRIEVLNIQLQRYTYLMKILYCVIFDCAFARDHFGLFGFLVTYEFHEMNEWSLDTALSPICLMTY